MLLKDPPVVEVGIDFQFDPNPEKSPWEQSVAKPFVERFKDDLPRWDSVYVDEIRIAKRSPEGLPERLEGRSSLDYVKAFDGDERRGLEVGNDRMGFRFRRGGVEYPGFQTVLEEALTFLTAYIEHFRPMAVRSMMLNYVDIVKIPIERGEGLELDDFFCLGLKLPEDPFGPLGAFSISFSLPSSLGRDGLRLSFVTEPKTTDNVAQFRMRWQVLCKDVNTLDQGELRQRLSMANEHIEKCFFACFTERGLALFNPVGL